MKERDTVRWVLAQHTNALRGALERLPYWFQPFESEIRNRVAEYDKLIRDIETGEVVVERRGKV